MLLPLQQDAVLHVCVARVLRDAFSASASPSQERIGEEIADTLMARIAPARGRPP
jgi:hypothetical protein